MSNSNTKNKTKGDVSKKVNTEDKREMEKNIAQENAKKIENKKESPLEFEEIFNSKIRSKILKCLAFQTELNITKLRILCKVNHTTIKKHLFELQKIGLVTERTFGRIKIYSYNLNNDLALQVKNLIIGIES